MIINQPCECETCNKKYRLRISLGHREKSKYSFKCIGCSQMLCLEIIATFDGQQLKANNISNCKFIGNQNFWNDTVINLHPDLIIPKDELQNPMYQPIVQYPTLYESVRANAGPTSRTHCLFEDISYGIDLSAQFNERIKGHELVKAGRRDLAATVFKTAKPLIGNYFHSETSVNLLLDLGLAIQFPARKPQLRKLKAFYNKAKKSKNGVELTEYIRTQRFNHFSKFLTAMKSFGNAYDELSRLLTYLRVGSPIPAGSLSASNDFENYKKLYGDGFETIMDLAITPSMVNNVNNGRTYDQFKSMDLSQYIAIDKAGKMRSFEFDPDIGFLLNGIDNQLRNGSHHGNIEIDYEIGKEIITFKSGRPPIEKFITYTDYLKMCIDLHFNIFLLFTAETLVFHDRAIEW